MTPEPNRLAGDEVLVRRLPPNYVVEDEIGGGKRMTSNAFVDNDEDGTSVFIKSKLEALGFSAGDVAASHGPGWTYAEITVAAVEHAGLLAVPDPDPDDAVFGAAHALIKGKPAGAKGTKLMRKLAKSATLGK